MNMVGYTLAIKSHPVLMRENNIWWFSNHLHVRFSHLTTETHGKQFSCQKHPVLFKSFTKDRDGRAAGSIE